MTSIMWWENYRQYNDTYGGGRYSTILKEYGGGGGDRKRKWRRGGYGFRKEQERQKIEKEGGK